MPAYELREHSLVHGYTVLGRYASPGEARNKANDLVAEDRQRLGRYTIDYNQQADPEPVEPAPEVQEDDEMGLRRTKVTPEQDVQGLPKNSAADMVDQAVEEEAPKLKTESTAREVVEAADDKPVKVSAAAREAGARKP